MKGLKNFIFKNKRVLVRSDFNVPLDKKRNILDDFRIKATIPTIEYLVKKEAKVILMSHLGKPLEKIKNPGVKKYSLIKVARRLEKLSGRPVKFLPDCIGEKVEKETEKINAGEIILLENIRFYKEEEENNVNFAKKLAKLGDIYINNAFSVCHRQHASITGIPKYLPSGAGFLLEKELKILSQIIKKPKKPLVIIIGGSKAGSKAKAAEKFSEKADFLLLGNLIARELKGKKIENSEKIFFPIDGKNNNDIGEKTIKLFKEKIFQAKTIFWAGPLGKIEEKEYQKGTREIARAIIKSKVFSAIGGGDTIEFINKIGLIEKFNHVSVGGGAMLAFLSGEKLPGLEILRYGNKKSKKNGSKDS